VVCIALHRERKKSVPDDRHARGMQGDLRLLELEMATVQTVKRAASEAKPAAPFLSHSRYEFLSGKR
jgi:hypothetical protein